MIPAIRTRRLVLRPFRDDDLGPLHAIFSKPVAMRYWDRPAWDDVSLTREVLAQFMADRPAEQLEFAVDLQGQLIGRVGLWRPYEVGYIFDPEHWGKGYASEAFAVLLREVFARMKDAHILTAEADPRNTGSVALLKRHGFRQTGLAEKSFDYGGIELCDTAYFELSGPNRPK